MYTNGVRQGLGGGGKRQYDMYVARARSVSPHGRLSSVQMMLQSPHSTVRYLAPGVSPFASPGYIQHPGSRAGLPVADSWGTSWATPSSDHHGHLQQPPQLIEQRVRQGAQQEHRPKKVPPVPQSDGFLDHAESKQRNKVPPAPPEDGSDEPLKVERRKVQRSAAPPQKPVSVPTLPLTAQGNVSRPRSSAVNGEYSDYDPVHEQQEPETILSKSAPKSKLRSAAPAHTSQTSQTSPLPAPKRTPLKDNDKSEKQEASQVSTDVGLRLMRRTDKAIIIASVVPGSVAAQQGSIQANDKLLAVNGSLTNAMNIDEIAAILRFTPGAELKLDVASGDAMPFVVRLKLPGGSSESNLNEEEEEEAPAVQALPKDPEDASWGMTLVLKEYLDLLYQFPDGLYQQTLARELGACSRARSDRFSYIGCEEGAEPGTVLVHINVRPAAADDKDERSAMNLSQAIGEQVADGSSLLFKGVITRKILHVGLHLPLKKLGDEIVVPRKTLHDTKTDEIAESLHCMIEHVRKAVPQRDGSPAYNKPSESSAATKVLSPGGQVYDDSNMSKRSEKMEKPGKVSSSRYSTSEGFMYALHSQLQKSEVSPVKPFRETIVETDRIRSENEWMKTMHKTGDSSDALLWNALQQESQAAVPHVQQLKVSTEEAEREAKMLREENEHAMSVLGPRRSHALSDTASQMITPLNVGGIISGVESCGVGLKTSDSSPFCVTAVKHVLDIMRTAQGQPNYLNDNIAVGDRIVSIDGFDAEDFEAHQLARKLMGPKDSWIDLGLVSAKSGRSYKVRLLRHDLQPGGGRISPAPQVLATRAAVSPRGSHKLDYAHNLWGISLEESTHGGLIKISRILDGSIASKPCGVTSNGQTTSVHKGDVLIAIDGKMVLGKSITEAQEWAGKAESMQLLRKGAVSLQYTAYRTLPNEKREAFQILSQAALNVPRYLHT